GIGKADNAWWLDVLEWGQASPYAEFFDIDWAPAKAELRGKVLLPFLGDHYGAVLEAGELTPSFDAAEGSFGIRYHEHLFPINPAVYSLVLAPLLTGLADEDGRSAAAAELSALLARSRDLRSNRLSVRHRTVTRQRAAELKGSLAALAARDA